MMIIINREGIIITVLTVWNYDHIILISVTQLSRQMLKNHKPNGASCILELTLQKNKTHAWVTKTSR